MAYTYNRITDNKISNSPWATILILIPGSYKRYKKDPLQHFLDTAPTLIVCKWKIQVPPSYPEWLREMDVVYRVEQIKKINLVIYGHTL